MPATNDQLQAMLTDCGVAATAILVEQIATHVERSDGVFDAYQQMPLPLVCWWLGYQTVLLCIAEQHRQPYEERNMMAWNINATLTFLRDTATLNSREQPALAEQALTAVDGFSDELINRISHTPFGQEDLTYGGLILAPAGMPT